MSEKAFSLDECLRLDQGASLDAAPPGWSLLSCNANSHAMRLEVCQLGDDSDDNSWCVHPLRGVDDGVAYRQQLASGVSVFSHVVQDGFEPTLVTALLRTRYCLTRSCRGSAAELLDLDCFVTLVGIEPTPCLYSVRTRASLSGAEWSTPACAGTTFTDPGNFISLLRSPGSVFPGLCPLSYKVMLFRLLASLNSLTCH